MHLRKSLTLGRFTVIPASLLLTVLFPTVVNANQQNYALEEIIVTAQKREQSLQDAPIAISVLNSAQLDRLGIQSLLDFGAGAIPSLRIMPLGNTPSNLVIAIRGNSPLDPGEITRDSSVAVYIDDVYLGRSHGLGMELIDLERVEVLRGPQGTLFGRNAIGGAVSLVSKKPTGKFGFEQNVTVGRFNEFRSITRVNLPEYGNIKSKIDYIHSERDGWVENTALGQSDYNEYDKDGARLSINWQITDSLSADYIYDMADVETAQNYFQFFQARVPTANFTRELDRQNKTRLPVTPLKPTITEQQGHSVIFNWQVSDQILAKSISSYRELDEDANNNYAGVLYFNGLNDASVLEHYQLSQEFQLVGATRNLEWVGGLYYFKEDASKTVNDTFTLDIFGIVNGQPLTPITPPSTLNVFTGVNVPPRVVDAQADSLAIYGQTTWSIVNDRLFFTLGGRYTEDDKSAVRVENGPSKNAAPDSENFDGTIGLDYVWNDEISTYLKYHTAYKAGGVNTRSFSFAAFDEEIAKTAELGLKSEFWDRRLRFNAAVFKTHYEDAQLDFVDPVDPTIVETINAKNTVKVSGLETDLTIAPIKGLLVGLSYVYLDGDMPLQPNPLDNNTLKRFHVSFAPQHSGALTVDYSFNPWSIGTLKVHMDMSATDNYAYGPFGEQRADTYSILNARLTLADIQVGQNSGILTASLWGRNITDEEYIVNAFPVGDPALSIGQAFGDPRTVGVDISYSF